MMPETPICALGRQNCVVFPETEYTIDPLGLGKEAALAGSAVALMALDASNAVAVNAATRWMR